MIRIIPRLWLRCNHPPNERAYIGLLALVRSVKFTWSFSAFTVLVYYAITNLAGAAVAAGSAPLPALVAWAGLVACPLLAFWVDIVVAAAGLLLIGGRTALAARGAAREALAWLRRILVYAT